MEYSLVILTVNSSSIIILLVLAAILLVATRFRGENSYAAAIIIIPTIPVYLYNMCRMLWSDSALTMALFPISVSVNTLLMPLLWLFTQRNFDSNFRFRGLQLLHLLPMFVFLGLSLWMSPAERLANIRYEVQGEDTWFGDLNTSVVGLQMIGYFVAIFWYILSKRKYINDQLSDAEWAQKSWILRFMALFAVLFLVVMTSYALWPRTDAWLIQILNVVAMSYLVYSSIRHPSLHLYIDTTASSKVASMQPETESTNGGLSEEQMSEICQRAIDYLRETKAYLQYDLSLAMLAHMLGIPQRNLSRSINVRMQCNFFEFINNMRVEETKERLLKLDCAGYNIDSIYSECGFRSRSTFFMVFKKSTGMTPAVWLAKMSKD